MDIGTVSNVFFRISGNNKASYLYFNSQSTPNNIINCTFLHDLGSVDGSYSGTANFSGVLTNVKIDAGTSDNVVVKQFTNIESTKTDEQVNAAQVGVYFGDYAWE